MKLFEILEKLKDIRDYMESYNLGYAKDTLQQLIEEIQQLVEIEKYK